MDECAWVIMALIGVGGVLLPYVLWPLVVGARTRLSDLERRVGQLEKVRRPEPVRVAVAAPALQVLPPEPPPVVDAPPIPPPAVLPPKLLLPPRSDPAPIPAIPRPPRFRWEDFLGVKLFAWIGGLVAFLAVAFFVKYSYDNNLIPPAVRVALGLLTGLAVLAGGLRLDRARYSVLVQALCSAGLLMLYGNLFAAHALYGLIGSGAAFPLMILVTAAAFVLAVRLDAVAIAVLGLAGGFLTPPLLSTGEDRALALFSYAAMLDLGLVAVALRKKWTVLLPLGAVGTACLQIEWAMRFLDVDRVPVGMAVFGVFPWLFSAVHVLLQRRGAADPKTAVAALLPPLLGLGFALFLVADLGEAVRSPWLLFGFVFLVDLALVGPAFVRPPLRAALPVAGIVSFVIATVWSDRFLSPSTLPAVLVFSLVLAVVHGILPILIEKVRPGTPVASGWGHAFAPLAMVLVLVPLVQLPAQPTAVWPVLLLLSSVALAVAWWTTALAGFVAALVLTVAAIAISICRIPEAAMLPPGTLLLTGGFAVLFCAASTWLLKSLPQRATRAFAALPALSALLPFALLILVVARLALPDPSPVFALAALLVALVLGTSLFQRIDALLPVAWASVALLELAWHGLRFDASRAAVPVAWYTGFFAAFLAFPFVFRRRLEGRKTPWVVAALAGPAQFWLLHLAMASSAPGLLPIGFAIVYLGGLAALVRRLPADARERSTALAAFGAAALFFLTTAIPLQLDRQWITVGWALEGAALLWLFRRIPHEGLRALGVGLLVASFVRLLPGVNPFLLTYAERGSVPILNWFLYTYGIVAACQFAGMALVDRDRPKVLGVNAPALLGSLGTLLAFLLLNLEIADLFSGDERYVAFRFAVSLGQDMTYSIGWALFALVLLAVGIAREIRGARYAGLGLLVLTLSKVFLYDLGRLSGLYRVGSLVGLAVALLAVSYLYQRFLKAEPEAAR